MKITIFHRGNFLVTPE